MTVNDCIGAAFDAYQLGIPVRPEIMFPLVCTDHEIECVAPVVKNAAASTVAATSEGSGFAFTYRIGTMLEGSIYYIMYIQYIFIYLVLVLCTVQGWTPL